MAQQVPIGTRATADERVQFENTLRAHDHSLPAIFATPEMIRLMEIAALKALQPFCEPGEISVGTAVNVEHRAPVGLNAVVKATAELTAFDGRFYQFKVAAHSGKVEIGRGTITRAIININAFLDKWEIPRP